MAEEYRWLVYMAGDNDLSERVDETLNKMQAGVSDVISVAVHADFRGQNTKRFVINTRGKTKKVDLPFNSNAGLPATLSEFLNEGKNGAKHNIACIWSHGYGWFGTAFERAANVNAPVRNSRKAMMVASRGLFRTAVEQTVEEATPSDVDESGRDFLDLAELHQGFDDALQPRDKFAVIGCDACYMAMVEVGYELRNVGEILVASEEEEEPRGWDYESVFRKLVPGLSAKEVATRIVEAYEPETLKEPRATLSAIKLDEMGEIARALNDLGALLTPLIATSRFDAIKRARAKVHTFKLYHYIDLLHFAECLKAELSGDRAVEDVADAADDVIKAVNGAVIATRNGAAATNAHGIAIYLPNEPVNEHYASLQFAQAAPQWTTFVQTYGDNR